jgi:ribosome-binding factor A
MATIHRINRLRELLLRELSDILARMKDPRIQMVTVVATEVSKDLRYAKMFVSVIGSADEQKEAVVALEKAMGFIRREVGKRIQLRYVPEIRVIYDNTMEKAAHITALIDSLGIEKDGEEGAGNFEGE